MRVTDQRTHTLNVSISPSLSLFSIFHPDFVRLPRRPSPPSSPASPPPSPSPSHGSSALSASPSMEPKRSPSVKSSPFSLKKVTTSLRSLFPPTSGLKVLPRRPLRRHPLHPQADHRSRRMRPRRRSQRILLPHQQIMSTMVIK